MDYAWITIDDGETFEGHMGHWADCYGPLSTLDDVFVWVTTPSSPLYGSTAQIRNMTDEEVKAFPEIVEITRKYMQSLH